MQQLLDFIEARHKLMFEMDGLFSLLPLTDQAMRDLLHLPPIEMTPEKELTQKNIAEKFFNECEPKLKLLNDCLFHIPNEDFVQFFSSPIGTELQITPMVERYFNFLPLQVHSGDLYLRYRRLFDYYICFLAKKTPLLLQKVFQRLVSKCRFKFEKIKIIIGPEFSFASNVGLHMTPYLESQLQEFLFSLAFDCRGYVFFPEEIKFFHEFLHMLHFLTGRWLEPANDQAHEQIHRLRALSAVKEVRYKYRYYEFLSKKDTFGDENNPVLYEEFHTIRGGAHAIGEGLNENALRYSLRLRLRHSHFGWNIFKLLKTS